MAKLTWETIERTIKVLAIVGGAVSAWGAWSGIQDLNDKAAEKAISEWQRAVVYDLIQHYPAIRFDNLSIRYVTEAQKLARQIPREKIDDPHLRLAILDLIQGNAIEVTPHGGYVIKAQQDIMQTIPTAVAIMKEQLQLTNDLEDKAAKYGRYVTEMVRENSGKYSMADLKAKLASTADPADRNFIDTDFDHIARDLLSSGVISEDSDGKVYFGRPR